VRTFLITSKATDARRQGATTEAYEAIRRKEGANEGNAADDVLMVDQGKLNGFAIYHTMG
jgi:hypothetical protein